jgi:hypothetical protein
MIRNLKRNAQNMQARGEIRNYIPLTSDRNRLFARQVYNRSEIMRVCLRVAVVLKTVCAAQKEEDH